MASQKPLTMRLLHITLVIYLIIFSACDNSLPLNDDWEDITIVYGVLNSADTAHYIKINKAFLGDGNAYDMAKESDSIQYATELTVRLIEYELMEINGELTDPYIERNWERTDRLDIILYRTDEISKDTLSENGDEPVFGSQVNYLYKTTERLSPLFKYVLEIEVPGKAEVVSAETFLIGSMYVEKPRRNNPQTFNSPIHLQRYLRPEAMEWRSAIYGKMYEPVLRFNYIEIIDNDTTYESVELKYKTQIVVDTRMPSDFKGQDMKQEYGGEDFYYRIGESIKEKVDVKRKAIGLDFIFYIGGNNLNTYISASNSVGIGQNQSDYSNIVNGKGIFGARYTYTILNKEIYGEAIDSLAYGVYTKHLNFANYFGQWK